MIATSSVSPNRPIEKRLAKAMESVGSLAWKLVEDLLLAKAKLAAGGGALAEEAKLSRFDELVVVNIAVKLELAATNALDHLMGDNELWKLLQEENARRLGKAKSRLKSEPFEKVLRENLSAACKEITKKLEQRRVLVDDGDYYKFGDDRIKKSSIPAKVSRLRRSLLRS